VSATPIINDPGRDQDLESGPSQQWRPGLGLVALILGLGILAALAGARITGALKPDLLVDISPLVRFGLPVAGTIADLAAALTVGALVMAATALPVGGDTSPEPCRPAMTIAAAAAGVWALAELTQMIFVFADISATPLLDSSFGAGLFSFVRDIDLGRGYLVGVLIAMLVSLGAAGSRSLRSAGLLSVVAMIGLVPLALRGHTSTTSDHYTAVTALGLHVLGVCVWVGGLAVLMMLRRSLDDAQVLAAAHRFSTLALWCFVAVAASGVISALLRIGSFAGLRTAYGALVIAKTVLLVALGLAGLVHRRSTLRALAAGVPTAFRRLAIGEVALMAIASGLAVALSRSAPPVPDVPPAQPTAAQQITGFPLPPPATWATYFTQWRPDLFWLILVGLGAAGYLAGVIRLRRRGDAWPIGRTAAWLAAMVVLAWATSGGAAVYGRFLFSAHMLGHMTESMLVPMFAVMGAPITLALRTLPVRDDGTRGAREWLLALVHSRFATVVANPFVAGILFGASIFAFYFSGLFPLAMSTHVGHELAQIHFLAAGFLFMWVLMGVDPGPPRPAPPLRLLVLFIVVSVHSFFGVILMMSKTVLAGEYYGSLGRTWGPSLLADQNFGGSLAWGFGEIPMFIVALVLFVQWMRSDERAARRLDRAADRDGDAELQAYNAMLAKIAERDSRRER